MPYVSGFLRVIAKGHPGNELPSIDRPTDPDYGIEGPINGAGQLPVGPTDPGYGVPLPPIIGPGQPISPGGTPGHDLPHVPTYPVRPDAGLPIPPPTPGLSPGWPEPPVGTWPPSPPIHPSHPIYPSGGHPAHPLPPSPGHPSVGLPPASGVPDTGVPPPGSVYPPLPPSIRGPIIAFCWLVGIGYRWVVLDPSLMVDNTLPEPPVSVGGPTPSPRR